MARRLIETARANVPASAARRAELVDTNGDGQVDTIAIDTLGDGIVDTMIDLQSLKSNGPVSAKRVNNTSTRAVAAEEEDEDEDEEPGYGVAPGSRPRTGEGPSPTGRGRRRWQERGATQEESSFDAARAASSFVKRQQRMSRDGGRPNRRSRTEMRRSETTL